MSFEGEFQILCKKGHQVILDAYYASLEHWVCPICGQKAAWYAVLDHTNKYTKPRKLEMLTDEQYETCTLCGTKKLIVHKTFKIPDKGGVRLESRHERTSRTEF